jgi:NAD(P)H-dependent flavin oxidoreductase YrpB (nitropropane dioxygenase family)
LSVTSTAAFASAAPATKENIVHTKVCDMLGIEFPIFAFSHCRDVVAAVSKAGGFGVLGAVGFPPEQLEIELKWIDEQVGDRPYGVDIVIPGKYEGMGELDPKKLEEMLRAAIPQQHRDYVQKILSDHGVPKLPEGEHPVNELLGWTAATATPQVEVALQHAKVRLIANALGTPPPEVIAHIHDSGRLVAALCGTARQARSHRDAGIDLIIAQGTEGGGHTGEIGSMVLWPEVIDAVAPTPVLAAGGVGTGRQIAAALAMGAAGVWTGSIWLTVLEAESPPAQRDALLAATSKDTVRSRSFTGKPCRMLRNDWTEAWEAPDSPKPLGMPLQFMVTSEAVSRGHRYADKATKVMFNPVGQIVGQMNAVQPVKDVIYNLVQEYLESVDRLQALNA